MTVEINIYRNFNIANPYIQTANPAACAIKGDLRHHVNNGKFGFNTELHWTHVLLCSPGTDIRSAYDSDLNQIDFPSADTVLVKNYPNDGMCTAFVVVAIQKVMPAHVVASRIFSTGGVFFRCFLDRARPIFANCPPCKSTAPASPPPPPPQPGSIQTDCCVRPIPQTLFATLMDTSPTQICGCVTNTSFPMQYDSVSEKWESGDIAFGSCGTIINFKYHCYGISSAALSKLIYAGCNISSAIGIDPALLTCNPFYQRFELGPLPGCCGGPINANIAIVITE